MRLLKIGIAVSVVAIVAVAALLSIGIPSGFINSAIQQRVARDTGYRIEVSGKTTLRLWPLTVTMHDVAVQDPTRGDGNQLTIGSVSAALPFAGLFSGNPQITELTIEKPLLRIPLLRERDRSAAAAAAKTQPAAAPGAVPGSIIEQVTISDGTVVFSNPADRVESRVDGISLDLRSGPDRRVSITGQARVGTSPLSFVLKATMPAPPLGRQTIPVELKLEAPQQLRAAIAAKAEVRLNRTVLLINGLSGNFGDDQFNGWASADLASKPLVKLDLDFQRLDFGTPAAAGSSLAPAAPWSDAPIDLAGLNYVDAQLRISAAELKIGAARFAPAAIDATLAAGALKATFSQLGVYGGQTSGEVSIDVSRGAPAYALTADLAGVRALPLLSGLADFDRLDGRMQAKLALRSAGGSQRALIGNLAGTAFVNVQDGEIRGLNVAKMIRALTSGTLQGWQQAPSEATDLSQLSASFQIERGQAATSDLVLMGPLVRMTGAGTIDLPGKALGFRVEPKLVLTTQGQGGAADPVGLGIPVLVQGAWSDPRIYPDVAGILDNPDAAYARLREMGQGLFGAGDGANPLGGKLGEKLGTLLQQGLGGDRRGAQPPGSPPGQPPSGQDADATMNAIMKQLFGR